MRSETKRTHRTLLLLTLSAFWLHVTSNSYYLWRSANVTVMQKTVENTKIENKPDLHILHLNLTLVSFPEDYISQHLTNVAPN